ncbi:unnamed protein product [Lota lota]
MNSARDTRNTLRSLGRFPPASSPPFLLLFLYGRIFFLSSFLFLLLLNGNGFKCQLFPIVGHQCLPACRSSAEDNGAASLCPHRPLATCSLLLISSLMSPPS